MNNCSLPLHKTKVLSPRPKRYRKVEKPPPVKGFRPTGSRTCFGKEVVMLYEEYEALRLSDYDKKTHEVASRCMDVSRPTFTRIYEKARSKVATAFVENRPIVIEGGNVQFTDEWYYCMKCRNTYAPVDHSSFDGLTCPLCGDEMPTRMAGNL